MKKGDRVTYIAPYIEEHGIVKKVQNKDHVFVVYHCNEDWKNYEKYTGESTRIVDLVEGWV